MPRNSVQLTPDELVSTIRRSQLPTLLVEGDDDIVVFRKLEERHADISLSLMQSGGRASLLKVFERKNEMANINIGFIADLDSWIVQGVPDHYQSASLIFTNGYSIENDMFSDGDLINMISDNRRPAFMQELTNFIEFFALELDRYLRGEAPNLDIHINAVLDEPGYREARMVLSEGENYPVQLQQRIQDDFAKLVRGKNLLQLAIRHLTENGPALHPLNVLLMVAHRKGPALSRIFDAVAAIFQQQKIDDPDQRCI